MNAPDHDAHRRAVTNQRGPIRIGRLARLHRILQEQRLMANEPQAQQAANAPQADPNALAAELCQHVQAATRQAAGAPPGVMGASINWGAFVPTAAELAELQGISKEAVAFIMKYALSRVGAVFGG